MEDVRRRSQALLFAGALLVLIGLLSGAAVPAMATARLALSAHLAGVQGGMLLLIVGVAWHRIALSPTLATTCFVTSVFSSYVLYLALQLAAFWATSRSTPIAGAGSEGSPLQEAVVDGFLYVGSAAALVAVALMAWGLRPSLVARAGSDAQRRSSTS